MRALGFDPVAAGSSVRLELPGDEAQAVAAIERLRAGLTEERVVCVLSGAWGDRFLGLLERERTVRADGPPVDVTACRRALRRHGVAVERVPRPTGGVARLLLGAGWTSPVLVRWVGDGPDDRSEPADGEAGQALLVVLLGLLLALLLAGALGALALASGDREEQQRAVDVAALAAAAQLRAAGGGGAAVAGWTSGAEPAAVRAQAVSAARTSARANGAGSVVVDFPGGPERGVPTRVRVRAEVSPRRAGVRLDPVTATAEVAVVPDAVAVATGDEYAGPLAIRQGRPMRPDVALAFDRMNAAATTAGHPLTVVSGYRSNAEQARLFAAHPDPKWVARPGTSLHRLGTELDLGPASAYGWLAANAERFGFRIRYAWEPWHAGFVRQTASAHVAEQGRNPAAPVTGSTIPPWVPARYRDLVRAASIRFRVSAAMLAAQLKAESDFDPRVVSSAGAQGIAQFMPGTAAAVGLRDPFDPAQAIPAQAQLMARLLRRFGSVPLALAAYNAGEGRVGACHCVPPYPETQRYVARIVALMRGYDDDGVGLAIRLVE